VGSGLLLAFLQASDQKVSEDMRLQGGDKAETHTRRLQLLLM
jgi:hypothetical protein